MGNTHPTPACYFYRVQIETIDSYRNKTTDCGSEVFLVYAD